MKKLLQTALALALVSTGAASTYVAYPLATAWSIREAIRSGDAAYLERKIEWARVRETLRSSMTRVAFDLPDPETPDAAPKPGIWKRVKAYVGSGAVNRFVETYVTPEGLPKLFEYRKIYRQAVASGADEEKLPLTTLLANFWSRLKRAEFRTLTLFEVEMADRYEPSRRHVALLELRGLEWKLVELRVREAGDEPSLATAVLPTDR